MSLNGANPIPMSAEGQAGELIEQLSLTFMQVTRIQNPQSQIPVVANGNVLPAAGVNQGQEQPLTDRENAIGQTLLWMLAASTPNMEVLLAAFEQRFYSQGPNGAQYPRGQDSDQEMAENGQVQDLSQAVRQLRM